MEIKSADVCIIQLEDVLIPYTFFKYVNDQKTFPSLGKSQYSFFFKRADDYATYFLRKKLRNYDFVSVYSKLTDVQVIKFMKFFPSVSKLLLDREIVLHFPGKRGKLKSIKSRTGTQILYAPYKNHLNFKIPAEEIIFSIISRSAKKEKIRLKLSKVVLYASKCNSNSFALKYLQKYVPIKAVKIFELRNDEANTERETLSLVDSPSPTFLSIQLRELEDNEKKVEKKFEEVSENFHITYESIYHITVNDSWPPESFSKSVDSESIPLALESLLLFSSSNFREKYSHRWTSE